MSVGNNQRCMPSEWISGKFELCIFTTWIHVHFSTFCCNPFCFSVDTVPTLTGWYNLPILVTRMWAEWLLNWNSVPSMDRDFICSQQHSDWFWSPPSLLLSEHRASPRVKHPGYEAKYSPVSSAKVNNPQNYSSTLLYIFMLWCFTEHCNNYSNFVVLFSTLLYIFPHFAVPYCFQTGQLLNIFYLLSWHRTSVIFHV